MTSLRTPRHILVIGSGGREHALAWRLRQDPGVERVVVAPGNAGMADVAEIAADVPVDAATIAAFCERDGMDLVVIGPEAPLVDGLADQLRAQGIAVFGPDSAAAQLEGSKAFCRDVAQAARIPMADGIATDDPAEAVRAARRFGGRVVIKADGLAAGKGVTVCDTLGEAEAAIRAAMVERVFGAAGATVIVERALAGPEASVIAICDANHVLALPAARDHKRIFDGDLGPNTGGMGAYAPLADLSDADVARIADTVHRPTLAELARRGAPFRGALFAGLMLTAEGPYLLEFNVRFGDPETQVLLPSISGALAPLLAAAAIDRLAEVANELGIRGSLVPTAPGSSVGVVLAARGYPGTPVSGDPISGIEAARETGALVFCAGVREAPGSESLVTNGGRVLTMVGRGPSMDAAATQAYDAADRIGFAGRQLRRDIGRATTGAPARAEGPAGTLVGATA